jgi:hypothetical protein
MRSDTVQYSTVQYSVLTNNMPVGNGACVGVAVLLRKAQNILMFGAPNVEHSVCLTSDCLFVW